MRTSRRPRTGRNLAKLKENFDNREGSYTMTFSLNDSTDGICRGITYYNPQLCIIYPHRHETIDDIICTINHEALHMALTREELDVQVEHRAIEMIMWAVSGMYD